MIHSDVNMTLVSFADNSVINGGAGVVSGIGSELVLHKVKSMVSIRKEYDEIVLDSGFVSLAFGSKLNVTDS